MDERFAKGMSLSSKLKMSYEIFTRYRSSEILVETPSLEFQTARNICYYWDIEFEDAYDTDNRS